MILPLAGSNRSAGPAIAGDTATAAAVTTASTFLPVTLCHFTASSLRRPWRRHPGRLVPALPLPLPLLPHGPRDPNGGAATRPVGSDPEGLTPLPRAFPLRSPPCRSAGGKWRFVWYHPLAACSEH